MALEDLKAHRLQKLQKIKSLGINPYPARSKRQHTISQSREMMGQKVSIAGRIRSIRPHGKITFMDLEDFTGKIQLFFAQEQIENDLYSFLPLLDIGDFIDAQGEVFTTQAGEITVRVENYTLLTKSLRPIPTEWYGLKDIETRLRKRYLDLLVNPEVRDLFVKKHKFWQAVRTYLLNKGFIEVETPALEPIAGGADANPFVTYHQALDQNFYLRISLELYQKRLLVGGYEKIFEIGKVFRNEGIDAEHLQDYLAMEFYWAYASYEDLINLTQDFFQYLVKETMGTTQTTYQGHLIDWSGTWPRIDYVEQFKEITGIDLDQEVSIEQLRSYAQKEDIKVDEKMGKGRLIDAIYKKKIRPTIIQPVFLINHPIEVSPLAKSVEGKPRRVERLQVIMGGAELCNAYSELNDPVEQLRRFEEQQKMREAGDQEAQMLDLDFIEALEYGMPPAAGFGLSQRLFAAFVDKPIRETVFFPPLKQGS